MSTTKRKDRWDVRELAEVLGVSKVFDSVDEWEPSSTQVFTDYSKEGLSEEDASEAAAKAEDEARDEAYRNLMRGFDYLLEQVQEIAGIHFVKSKKGIYRATCPNWGTACGKIVSIINGVGMFYFQSVSDFRYTSSCSTYRQAALSHLHWIKRYPEVYGSTSFENMVRRYMRD